MFFSKNVLYSLGYVKILCTINQAYLNEQLKYVFKVSVTKVSNMYLKLLQDEGRCPDQLRQWKDQNSVKRRNTELSMEVDLGYPQEKRGQLFDVPKSNLPIYHLQFRKSFFISFYCNFENWIQFYRWLSDTTSFKCQESLFRHWVSFLLFVVWWRKSIYFLVKRKF